MEKFSEERTKVLLSQVSKIFEYHVFDIERSQGFPQLERGGWEKIRDKLSLTRFPSIYREEKIPYAVPKDSELSKSPLVEINDDYKLLVISKVYRLEVNGLYPSIVIKYAQSGAIADDAIVRIFYWLWSNRILLKTQYLSGDGYTVLRLWLNYFYGMMPKLGVKGTGFNQEVIATKARQIMEEFLKWTEEWYYVDTDELYFYHSDIREYRKKIISLGIPFEIEEIDHGIFFSKKKYLVGRIDDSIGFKRK